jgi:hypothetical protein
MLLHDLERCFLISSLIILDKRLLNVTKSVTKDVDMKARFAVTSYIKTTQAYKCILLDE